MEFRTKLIHAGISQDQETGLSVYLSIKRLPTSK